MTAFRHPLIEVRQGIQIKGRGSNRCQLSRLVNQKSKRTQENTAQGGVAGRSDPPPRSGQSEKPPPAKQQHRDQLHQHVAHLQTDHSREQRDPLMSQRWIGGLGKAREPLLIPGIEPVMGIMRREKHVKVRIERTRQEVASTARSMNGQRHQNNCKQENWTRVAFGQCPHSWAPHEVHPSRQVGFRKWLEGLLDFVCRYLAEVLSISQSSLTAKPASEGSRRNIWGCGGNPKHLYIAW